jgi:hypothetical protein
VADPHELLAAAGRLADAAAATGWRGPDPYDGLWFGWPRTLVGGRRRRQAVVQAHARAPVDVRRVYRRGRHPLIPKTLGLFAAAGAGLRAADERHARQAQGAADLLHDGDRGWGYPFDVQTRWSFYPAGAANVVVTAYGIAGLRAVGREADVERARLAARWLRDELYVPGEGFWAYHPHSATLIHNANVLGARAVHETLGEADAVARAVERTLAAQAPDGSWPYGDGPGLEWVDSFHTGYVLTCLTAMRSVDPPRIDEAVARGAEYYADRFFKPSGAAKLFAAREYPEDGHSSGTGLTTLAVLVAAGHADRAMLERVARYTVDRMLAGDHAVFRRYRRYRTTPRYIRWCDGHVALGLVDAARALG